MSRAARALHFHVAMLRHTLRYLAFFPLAFAPSCSGTSDANASAPAVEMPSPPEGVVFLPEVSRRFVEVEEVSADKSAGVLRAPVQVVFRDGAISRIGSLLPGRVVRVHVRTGDKVKAGDLLVTLDCPEAASSRAALATAVAATREARASFERQDAMLQQGVGTEREQLEAERHLAETNAELARAQAAVQFVGNNAGTTVVLRSSMAGTVVSRSATVGAAVEPGGAPLVEVGDPSQLWIVADVFERDLHLVREGATAQVELPSVSAPISGQVASIGAVVDGSTRAAPVRISFDQNPVFLRPGMFARVTIESPNEATAIPIEAVLLRDGRKTFVYVETGAGEFSRRPVVVAQPIEGKILVTSGISPGDRVVVRGALLLDGAAEQLL